jgi:hypothetical protein
MRGILLIDLFVQRYDIIWAFKIKQFPDGLIKGFKGHICAQGDQQEEEVDCFKTCSSCSVDYHSLGADLGSFAWAEVKAG